MTVVSLREYIFVIVGSLVLSLGVIGVLFRWACQARMLIAIALTITIGIVIWNTLLNVTNAAFLNVDSPVLGLSVQDVGSGIAAFLVTAVLLRSVPDRNTSTGRILGVSAVAGLVTILVDLFG